MAITVKQLLALASQHRSESARHAKMAEQFEAVAAYFEEHGEGNEKPPSSIIKDTGYLVLKEHGSPMHYKEIRIAVEARGVKVPGQEPDRNMGAHMSQDARFKSHKKGMWGLAEWDDKTPIESMNSDKSKVRFNVEDVLNDLESPSRFR
jgi:hypothetical protein